MRETLGSRPTHWRLAAWGAAAALLMLPLVAMWFTSEVAWGIEDFAAAAALIGGAGLAFEIALRLTGNMTARVLAGLAIAGAFALIWAQLAVEIF